MSLSMASISTFVHVSLLWSLRSAARLGPVDVSATPPSHFLLSCFLCMIFLPAFQTEESASLALLLGAGNLVAPGSQALEQLSGFKSSVTWHNEVNLSMPQFPHLWNGGNNSTFLPGSL